MTTTIDGLVRDLRERVNDAHTKGLEYEITLHTDEVLTILDALDLAQAVVRATCAFVADMKVHGSSDRIHDLFRVTREYREAA